MKEIIVYFARNFRVYGTHIHFFFFSVLLPSTFKGKRDPFLGGSGFSGKPEGY